MATYVASTVADTEGIHVVRLNPHLRQNYSIFMRNFKQNNHKLSNNRVQFSNRNLLCKFEPPSKKSWIRPCFYHSFYHIYMGQPIWDPYGTRLHCPYGSHTGVHMGPIRVSYRLLAGFFKRQISAKPECSRGGGGGVSIFFCMRRLEPSIYLSPPKISGISSTQNFFTRAYVYMKISEYPPPPPPPPPGVFLHSYTRCPNESDKTGVMKIATRQ